MTEKKLNFLFVLFAMLFSVQAEAVVLLQQVSASAGTDFDDNPTMVSQNAKSVYSLSFVPRFKVTAVDGVNRWYAGGSLNVVRSSNKNITTDREDPSFDLGWDRELEKGHFGLVGRYSKSSTRFTEFDTSGLVSKDATAENKSLSANWSRLMTEKLNLSLSAQHSETSYSSGNFVDYSSNSINATTTYQYSEYVSPFVQVGWTGYRSDKSVTVPTNNSNSQNYMLGANFNASPNFSYNFSAGITHIDTSGNGKVYNVGFNYLAERYSFTGSLGRSVSPTSIGGFQESDRLGVGLSYELNNKSRVGGDFSWNQNNSLNDIETKQLSAYYTRDLSDTWQMRISAKKRNLKSNGQSSDGNSIGVTLSYSTPEF